MPCCGRLHVIVMPIPQRRGPLDIAEEERDCPARLLDLGHIPPWHRPQRSLDALGGGGPVRAVSGTERHPQHTVPASSTLEIAGSEAQVDDDRSLPSALRILQTRAPMPIPGWFRTPSESRDRSIDERSTSAVPDELEEGDAVVERQDGTRRGVPERERVVRAFTRPGRRDRPSVAVHSGVAAPQGDHVW